MNGSQNIAGDVALISERRPWRVCESPIVVRDRAEDALEVLLLRRGAALLSAETHFGPHSIASLGAPVFLTLHRALTGSLNVCRFATEPGSELVVYTPDEARILLFSASPTGGAFRRVALASITAALRSVTQSLKTFFEAAPPLAGQGPPSPAAPEVAEAAPDREVPADLGRVYDLFDAAGLDPRSLPELGLTARRIPGGARLLTAGDKGREAFLIVEGQLRVSIHIDGVGEEALAFLGPGEVVGEMALVDDAPRSANVFAHGGPVLVFALPVEVFKRLLVDEPRGCAPLVGGIAVTLARRFEEALLKAASFRVLAGPF